MSKTKPIEDLRAAYEHEQRHFGENYVRQSVCLALSLSLSLIYATDASTRLLLLQIQELIQKTAQLPADVKWHYIGHVQSNKAKALVRDVPNLFMVETVDSIKIANALNRASGEFRSTPLHVLLQVNTSGEEQKSGTTSLDDSVALAQHIVQSCEHLRLAGLMTIGRYGDTTSECFDRLVVTRQRIAAALNTPETDLALSMGMSSDFELAVRPVNELCVLLLARASGSRRPLLVLQIACGSTYVRVGSTIFGERNYASA